MTRFFLIESKSETIAWKMTGEMKKVLDYVCMGAEIKEGDDTIIAWFSSEIPVSAGPATYHGLPGLILGVEKNGEMVTLAASIDFSEPNKAALATPKEGKKMSQKEFDKVVAEKQEEFKKAGNTRSDKRGQ